MDLTTKLCVKPKSIKELEISPKTLGTTQRIVLGKTRHLKANHTKIILIIACFPKILAEAKLRSNLKDKMSNETHFHRRTLEVLLGS